MGEETMSHDPHGNRPEPAVVGYFTSPPRAKRTAARLGGQTTKRSRAEVRRELDSAPAGASTVHISMPGWAGLGLGAIAGAVVGALTQQGRLPIPGIAPALSAGRVAVVFLGIGIFGTLGWLIGATAPLVWATTRRWQHEVRIAATEEQHDELTRQLVNAGAAIVILTNGSGHTTATTNKAQ